MEPRTKKIEYRGIEIDLGIAEETEAVGRRLDRLNRNDEVFSVDDIGSPISEPLFFHALAQAIQPKSGIFAGKLRQAFHLAVTANRLAEELNDLKSEPAEFSERILKLPRERWAALGGDAELIRIEEDLRLLMGAVAAFTVENSCEKEIKISRVGDEMSDGGCYLCDPSAFGDPVLGAVRERFIKGLDGIRRFFEKTRFIVCEGGTCGSVDWSVLSQNVRCVKESFQVE